MATQQEAGAAGRPRRITRERIADAGIEMGLAEVTITGLAKRLGVSVVALYKHVDGVAALRLLVAEEIFARFELPPLVEDELGEHLTALAHALRRLVLRHPGLAGYLARVGRGTPVALLKIDAHQTEVAARFALTPTRAAWLLSTVAFHAVALSDLIYPDPAGLPPKRPLAGSPDLRTLSRIAPVPGLSGPEERFSLSMRALIVGALAVAPELP